MTPGIAAANPPTMPAIAQYHAAAASAGLPDARLIKSKTKLVTNNPIGNATSIGWIGSLLMPACERIQPPPRLTSYEAPANMEAAGGLWDARELGCATK